ncbi:MAG: hypothetical protein IKU04_05410 [Bacteroidales bacterium]|nr:hypothetical protein [Bacteroidales bacterium]
MITFDKLKLIAPINAIEIINDSDFEKRYEKDCLVALKYRQTTPFLLDITVNIRERNIVIEFCGKVLGQRYPSLISIKTIRNCLENINMLGICRLDADEMLHAEVLKADVTRDVTGVDTKELFSYLFRNIRSYKRYRAYPSSNSLTIEKNVTSPKIKKRLIIYNKYAEMTKAKNQKFLKEYNLENSFENVVRLELNLTCKKQVRESLHISDNRLSLVLESKVNPIHDFIKEVITPIYSSNHQSNYKSYLTMLVWNDCGRDIQKVEEKLRAHHPSRGANIKKMMEPFRSLTSQWINDKGHDSYERLLRELTAMHLPGVNTTPNLSNQL